MAKTLEKSRRRPGRPTRDAELRRAMAEFGVDPAMVDPRRVLASIAVDTKAPAGARVQAARALLGECGQDQEDVATADAQTVGVGAISVRALQLLKAGRGH